MEKKAQNSVVLRGNVDSNINSVRSWRQRRRKKKNGFFTKAKVFSVPASSMQIIEYLNIVTLW